MDQKAIVKKKTDVKTSEPGTSISPSSWAGLMRGIDRMFDQFRRSYEELMLPFFPPSVSALGSSIRYPLIDLVDNGDHYVITAELPGMTKDTVEVSTNNYTLEINAQTSDESKEGGKDYLYQERICSAYHRTITFPEEVLPAKVEGTLKDGILKIRVPKKEPKPEEMFRKVELK